MRERLSAPVKKITIEYEDGTKEDIKSGVIMALHEIKDEPNVPEGEKEVVYQFLNCDLDDLEMVIRGTIQMGEDFGVVSFVPSDDSELIN